MALSRYRCVGRIMNGKIPHLRQSFGILSGHGRPDELFSQPRNRELAMKNRIRSIVAAKCFAPILLALAAGPLRADIIMDWNGRADTLATEQRQTPVGHARVLALMHVAMFEAVNAIEQRY